MNKNLLVGVGVTLAILLGLVGVFKDSRGNVQNTPQQNFGSVASPDIMSPYFSFGGVVHWGYRQDMRQASSTLCSMQSPAATTTIVGFPSANFTTAASYTTVYAWGNATDAFSTTTLMGNFTIIAANKGLLIASSTAMSALQDSQVIPPLTYINFKLSTGTASATFAPVGTCSLVLREVD